MTNLLRAQLDNRDRLQKQKDNVSREMDILRKNQKGMLENRNYKTEIKNTFDGLLCRLHTLSSRTSQQNPKNQKAVKKKRLKQNRIFNNCGAIIKVQHMYNGSNRRRQKEREEIFETITIQNFPQINHRHRKPQIQVQKNQARKMSIKIYTWHIIFKLK